MSMAIFSNVFRKTEDFYGTVYLLFPVLLKALDAWHFAAVARIAVKCKRNVAVGDFYLKVK